jgi:hypothetical protein
VIEIVDVQFYYYSIEWAWYRIYCQFLFKIQQYVPSEITSDDSIQCCALIGTVNDKLTPSYSHNEDGHINI